MLHFHGTALFDYRNIQGVQQQNLKFEKTWFLRAAYQRCASDVVESASATEFLVEPWGIGAESTALLSSKRTF